MQVKCRSESVRNQAIEPKIDGFYIYSDSKGRGFESLRAGQLKKPVIPLFSRVHGLFSFKNCVWFFRILSQNIAVFLKNAGQMQVGYCTIYAPLRAHIHPLSIQF